jgi:hypothetical protein
VRQAADCYADVKKVRPQVLLQLASAHKELYVSLEMDFSNVDVTMEDDPTAKAVLNARTQLTRTSEVIPDIQAKAEMHKDMLDKGEKPPGSHGDILIY